MITKPILWKISMAFKVPNQHRIISGPLGSPIAGSGNNGAFMFKLGQVKCLCVASDGEGWEHVSITLDRKRCPDWDEMSQIKGMFWDEDDCVVQFHPPKSDYVNNHPFCLHLWRPIGQEIPRPPAWMVGLK